MSEFENFSLRSLRRIRNAIGNAARLHPLAAVNRGQNEIANLIPGQAGRFGRRALRWTPGGLINRVGYDDDELAAYDFEARDYSSIVDEQISYIDEMESFRKGSKPFRRLGNFVRKNVGPIAQNLPGIAGVAGGILFPKREIQQNPETAVQVAQTPAAAANVVQALAPALPPAQQAQAVGAVMGATSPEQAAQVAQTLISAGQSAAAQKPAGKKKMWAIIAGVGGLLLVILIIWLIARKK